MRNHKLITLAIFLFSFSLINAQSAYPDFSNKLTMLLTQEKNQNKPLSIHIQQGDEIIYYKHIGLNSDKETFFDDYSKVPAPSLENLLRHYSVLILLESNKIKLDDNLLKFYPGCKNKHTASKITIRHLLTHSSGLKDGRVPKNDSMKVYSGEINVLLNQLNEISEMPGTKYEYAELNEVLLSDIIAKITKKQWFHYAKEKIMYPAGMTFSSFNNKGKLISCLVDMKKFLYALQHHLFLTKDAVEKSYQINDSLLVTVSWNIRNESKKDAFYSFHPSMNDYICYYPYKGLYLIISGNINQYQVSGIHELLFEAGISGH